MALTAYQKFVKAHYHKFQGTPQQIIRQVAQAWRLAQGSVGGQTRDGMHPNRYFIPNWQRQ